MDYESAVAKVLTALDKEIRALLDADKKDEANALHQARAKVSFALRLYPEMYTALRLLRSVQGKLS
jgi:hypothetical protein